MHILSMAALRELRELDEERELELELERHQHQQQEQKDEDLGNYLQTCYNRNFRRTR